MASHAVDHTFVVLWLRMGETVVLPSLYALILWAGTTFTVISCVAVAFRVQLE